MSSQSADLFNEATVAALLLLYIVDNEWEDATRRRFGCWCHWSRNDHSVVLFNLRLYSVTSELKNWILTYSHSHLIHLRSLHRPLQLIYSIRSTEYLRRIYVIFVD